MSTAVVRRRFSMKQRTVLGAVLSVAMVLTAQAVVSLTPASAAPPPTPLGVKINFGPAGAPATPAGFVQDTGAAYSTVTGRGWVRQDSLGATPVPLNLTANTRNRSATGCTGGTLQGRTFIHMQSPASSTTNTNVNGAWEYALPNGQYKVELG